MEFKTEIEVSCPKCGYVNTDETEIVGEEFPKERICCECGSECGDGMRVLLFVRKNPPKRDPLRIFDWFRWQVC